MATSHFLPRLPTEIRQDITSRLTGADLKQFSLTCKSCYQLAIPLLWSDVELVDCRALHDDVVDEHDDTPIIQKLLLLANKPSLASHVKVLTHRCHLPPPAIFDELPRMTFSGQTLSSDPRTIKLVQLAVAQMKNVHTLYIVLGHPILTDALVRCFFDANRHQPTLGFESVRKLWLENCRISAALCMDLQHHPYALPLRLDFSTLQSVRFRRVHMKPIETIGGNDVRPEHEWNYSRGGTRQPLEDGMGGSYVTTTTSLAEEMRAGMALYSWSNEMEISRQPGNHAHWTDLYILAQDNDDRMYNEITATNQVPSEVMRLGSASCLQRCVQAYRGVWLEPGPIIQPGESPLDHPREHTSWASQEMRRRETIPPTNVAMTLLQSASACLTNLTFDWIMTVPSVLAIARDAQALDAWLELFRDLFSCRFPALRSFQMRNSSVADTMLPEGLYLLDRSFPTFRGAADEPLVASSVSPLVLNLQLAGLSFMESHPNLRCLAWPMDHFFGPVQKLDLDTIDRVSQVIHNLADHLEDLRIDTLYVGTGEPASAENDLFPSPVTACRRRFISELAAKLRRIRSIKIEGGVPRDERREVVRALHHCPLEKIVMIGVCSPLGNTWGEDGADIGHIPTMAGDVVQWLEGEDKAAVHEFGPQDPQPPVLTFNWQPHYQWEGQPPMLHVLASYHAETVRELKFCGFRGSPIMFDPTPITKPMLAALRHFHNLESVIIGMWLPTYFEGTSQDANIIKYWLDMKTPTSTALVHVSDEEPQGWAKELQNKYAPGALADCITKFFGPYLSEQAKQRKDGVHVRASFCIGDPSSIFDIDLRIGKDPSNGDICHGYEGPRTEIEAERRRSKLQHRRWFG